MKRLGLGLLGLLCLSLVVHAGPIIVLFDEAHDEFNTISEARASIISRDHPEWYLFGRLAESLSNDYVLKRGLTPFDSAFLEGFDVLIIATPRAPFTAQELDALVQFVESGGGLLVVQDANPPVRDGSNQIAELFGLHFRQGVLRSEHGDWDAESFRVDVVKSAHPIVQGSDEFQMNWGCSIVDTPDCDVLLQSKGDTWQDSNGNQRADTDEPVGPLPVAVAKEVGEGRVVLIADNAFHDNIWDSNRVFFLRALRWLSGATAEPHAPGAISFIVDPDVTLDSVVQVGDGPQELSTEIKFYPNTRRILPGRTVYWTLDLGDLEGPFTITPEMDNDGYREETIRTSESMVVIAHTYATANIYVPYLLVYDGDGNRTEVHSRSVLGVIPDVAARQGLGTELPGSDGSPGDYLKGMNVYAFDYKLFGTPAGEGFIQEELDRVAGLGVNLMIYNIGWVFEEATDSLHEPVYSEAGWRDACCGWVSTFSIDTLIKLSDWCHERRMRVAIRYFLWRKCHESIGRESYDPSSNELYMEQQTAIKLLYAELCQSLGVEVFFLDAENDVFTREPRVKQLIQDIRRVYDGVLAGGAYSVDHLYACPFAGDLDLLAWSDYYFFTHGVSEDATTEQFRNAFLFHYSDDIAPVLDRFQKPGMVLETGVNIRETPSDSVERQYRGYLEAFEQLQREGAPLIGSGWWVWNLSDPPIEPHVMRGHTAESILGEYFGNILADRLSVHSSEGDEGAPSIDLVLRDFESGLPRYLISSQGSSITPSIVVGSVLGDHCLRLDLVPSSNPDYRHGFILEEHTPPLNWSGFSSLNFWLRSSNENWGLEVTLYDADGDRFSTRVNTKPLLAELLPESNGWRLVSIPLELFTKPAWDTGGNGSMDWRRVKNWGVGLFYKDQGAQTLWIDGFYLSTEGGLL
ncbi:DUF4350 domain-containing protein [Candidatus Bipolaricaulota bacterium]